MGVSVLSRFLNYPCSGIIINILALALPLSPLELPLPCFYEPKVGATSIFVTIGAVYVQRIALFIVSSKRSSPYFVFLHSRTFCRILALRPRLATATILFHIAVSVQAIPRSSPAWLLAIGDRYHKPRSHLVSEFSSFLAPSPTGLSEGTFRELPTSVRRSYEFQNGVLVNWDSLSVAPVTRSLTQR